MVYKDYLKSKEWKILRKKALEKAGYKCEFCGKKAYTVHHINYPKHLSQDSLKNLVVVCIRCHGLTHGIRNLSDIELNEEIIKRMNFKIQNSNEVSENYNCGFDMSGYGTGEEFTTDDYNEKTGIRSNEGNLENKLKNFNMFMKYFKDLMPQNFSFDDWGLNCWKGGIWWGTKGNICSFDIKSMIKEFNGEWSKDIIFWIIKNYGIVY